MLYFLAFSHCLNYFGTALRIAVTSSATAVSANSNWP